MSSFLHTPESANVIHRLHSRPAPFYAFALFVNPRLRSWQKRRRWWITSFVCKCRNSWWWLNWWCLDNKKSPPPWVALFFFLVDMNFRLVTPFVILCCCCSILWSCSPCLLIALMFKEATFFCHYYKDIDSKIKIIPLVVIGDATTCYFFPKNLCKLGHWIGH